MALSSFIHTLRADIFIFAPGIFVGLQLAADRRPHEFCLCIIRQVRTDAFVVSLPSKHTSACFSGWVAATLTIYRLHNFYILVLMNETWIVRHCGLVVSAPAWDGTGCEFDSWQCRIYIPCSLSLRLLGSLRGSLGTYSLTQKLC